jgi:hypothetical protein
VRKPERTQPAQNAAHEAPEVPESPAPAPESPPLLAGQPVEWLALVKMEDEDYRVLRVVTDGIPPGVEIGERSVDHVEAQHRFDKAALDIFERVANQ